MSYGNFKKRKAKSSYNSKGRRKTFKAKRRTDYSKKIKRLGIMRWVVLALIIVVFLLGVAIPLSVYFANSGNNPYADEQTQGEYFTEEQQQELILTVNKANPLESDYVPNLAEINSIQVNSLAKEDLQEMLISAEKDSVSLQIQSGYISFEEQSVLYEQALDSIKKQNNFSQIRAESETVKIVPKAGESEAQTGLLVCFYDGEESDFEKSKSFSWLSENAIDYGFVLRYPKDKEELTSMTYNPAVYRFVGKSNALQMRIFGMSLEEYRNYMEQK